MATCPKPSSKRLPSQLTELLDIAIFSFATISGLRSVHKVRGDPVIDGVCSLFGRMIDCASKETRAIFQDVTGARLGCWQPGNEATKELSTFISSRLKQAKEKDYISAEDDPRAPEALLHKNRNDDKEKDRSITTIYPRCWRCRKRCDFCKLEKKEIFISTLKGE